MMLNCDSRDRFVDQYLTLMIDSFSWTPMSADTLINFILKYSAFTFANLILTAFFLINAFILAYSKKQVFSLSGYYYK